MKLVEDGSGDVGWVLFGVFKSPLGLPCHEQINPPVLSMQLSPAVRGHQAHLANMELHA